MAGYVYAVIGVIYAVILAQVVIAAWEEYQEARAVADNEANAVLNLARLAQVWPEEDRLKVEDALSAYAEHVVDVEWPTMAPVSLMSHCTPSLIHDLWQSVNRGRSAGGRTRPSRMPRPCSSLMRSTKHAAAGCSWARTDCRQR